MSDKHVYRTLTGLGLPNEYAAAVAGGPGAEKLSGIGYNVSAVVTVAAGEGAPTEDTPGINPAIVLYTDVLTSLQYQVSYDDGEYTFTEL